MFRALNKKFVTECQLFYVLSVILNRCAILNDEVVSHCLTGCGKLFHSREATLAKARSLKDLKRVVGTFNTWSALKVIKIILNVISVLDW